MGVGHRGEIWTGNYKAIGMCSIQEVDDINVVFNLTMIISYVHPIETMMEIYGEEGTGCAIVLAVGFSE